MKRTSPEHVGELLQNLKEQNEIYRLLQAHEELDTLWRKFPDPTFRDIAVEMSLSLDGKLTISCGSSVSLNYLRLKRSQILDYMSDFMEKHKIKDIILMLK